MRCQVLKLFQWKAYMYDQFYVLKKKCSFSLTPSSYLHHDRLPALAISLQHLDEGVCCLYQVLQVRSKHII